MRKLTLITVLALSASMLTGCDFLRSLAGRPTSDDIAAKRILIAQKEKAEAEQALIPEVEADAEIETAPELTVSAQEVPETAPSAARTVEDSEILASLRAEGIQVKKASALKSFPASQIGTRYCVIVGAFSVKENADKVAKAASDAGFKTVEATYSNGLTAVGIIPSNSIVEVYNLLQKARGESFCPKDAWLLVNE